MPEARVTIINPLGLHARPAAQLVNLVRGFSSSVEVRQPESGRAVDGRSILSLLTLAASRGCSLEICAEGDDAAEVLAAVENLFKNGFGEM